MTVFPHREPPPASDGKPMTDPLHLGFYGCICRLNFNESVDGETYDRVLYIEPDCPFRPRHLATHQEKP